MAHLSLSSIVFQLFFIVKKQRTICTEPMDRVLCVLLSGLAASYLTLL